MKIPDGIPPHFCADATSVRYVLHDYTPKTGETLFDHWPTDAELDAISPTHPVHTGRRVARKAAMQKLAAIEKQEYETKLAALMQ